MSIWTDQKIKELLAKVAELEARLAALESKPVDAIGSVIPPFVDKRSKEYRTWKNANSQQ